MSVTTHNLIKKISQNIIAKRRTALWFFTQDVKTEDPLQKRHHISRIWRDMNPESKRKYHEMAELDRMRYQNQCSVYLSHVLCDQDENIDTNLEDLKIELEKHQPSYSHMIQAQSTKSIYKDLIDKTSALSISKCDILSSAPEGIKTILERPRMPPNSFMMFLSDHKTKILQRKKTKYPGMSFGQAAAMEWSKLSNKKRAQYIDKYSQLLDDYSKAMEAYKENTKTSDSVFLVEAYKEKKAFKKSLRKIMRKAEVVPVVTRNPFNFFLMDHKEDSLENLTLIWRNLPPEQKEKYQKLSQEDAERYKREKMEYEEHMKKVLEVLEKKSAEKGTQKPIS